MDFYFGQYHFLLIGGNAHRKKRVWRFRLGRVMGGIGFLFLEVGNSFGSRLSCWEQYFSIERCEKQSMGS